MLPKKTQNPTVPQPPYDHRSQFTDSLNSTYVLQFADSPIQFASPLNSPPSISSSRQPKSFRSGYLRR
ncbi:hypothetical protein A2U01_0106351 [Trifolium medium]|uniref:Uncharacterized protein n=1 Tax=Trifolium medium TaxID=97028 RepID=A0A392VCB2_9FABA|nr:hypothetical protein [Trifolium medium]